MKILDDRLGKEFPSPVRATPGSAGYDVVACITGEMSNYPEAGEELPMTVTILPGQRYLMPLGFAVHISDPTIAAVLLPRSGLGTKHGIVLGNLVGLVDSDYQGQVFASMWNTSTVPYTFKAGDKIAQMVFLPVITPNLVQTDTFQVRTGRGNKGFGSTGKQQRWYACYSV